MSKPASLLSALLCTFIWGTTFIAQDTGMDTIGPLTFNAVRFLIGFISAAIISREIWVAALRDINSRNNQSEKTRVTFLAKTKTAIQMLSILIYLFGLTINNMIVLFFADIILIIALLVTIQTGFQYTISTFKK